MKNNKYHDFIQGSCHSRLEFFHYINTVNWLVIKARTRGISLSYRRIVETEAFSGRQWWFELDFAKDRLDKSYKTYIPEKLRISLCKNQTSWEMKTFNPLQILHAIRHSGRIHKNALFKGRSTLVAMVTTAACSRPGASFSYKNVAKRERNVYFSISS